MAGYCRDMVPGGLEHKKYEAGMIISVGALVRYVPRDKHIVSVQGRLKQQYLDHARIYLDRYRQHV
jgi:hypothetical protein